MYKPFVFPTDLRAFACLIKRYNPLFHAHYCLCHVFPSHHLSKLPVSWLCHSHRHITSDTWMWFCLEPNPGIIWDCSLSVGQKNDCCVCFLVRERANTEDAEVSICKFCCWSTVLPLSCRSASCAWMNTAWVWHGGGLGFGVWGLRFVRRRGVQVNCRFSSHFIGECTDRFGRRCITIRSSMWSTGTRTD